MPRSTILVIDDEPNILTTVRRSLELEGYSVEVAGGGAAGLAKLVEHDIDMVLLDVMMPGETGLEVLPKLRNAKPETLPTAAAQLVAASKSIADRLEEIATQDPGAVAKLDRDALPVRAELPSKPRPMPLR